MNNPISFEALIRELQDQQNARKTQATFNLTVRLPRQLVDELEAVCEQYDVTRSDVVRNCLSHYLQNFKKE